jgi:hypothetical protein
MVESGSLGRDVEALHGGRATWTKDVPVTETFRGEVVWSGVVQVYRLEGHPEARRAYAWSEPVEGSDRRRVFAVLEAGPVRSAAEAVRASLIQREPRARA